MNSYFIIAGIILTLTLMPFSFLKGDKWCEGRHAIAEKTKTEAKNEVLTHPHDIDTVIKRLRDGKF